MYRMAVKQKKIESATRQRTLTEENRRAGSAIVSLRQQVSESKSAQFAHEVTIDALKLEGERLVTTNDDKDELIL